MSLSPGRIVSEDEADALELFNMLQDEHGVVTATSLNQLVKKYFALETEWVSRSGSASGKDRGSRVNTPLSPIRGGGGGSRPSTSEYLTRGVNHRHDSSSSIDGGRVGSAVALPSSLSTAVMARDLSGPQLLSFLLTTRYALAAGVRRRKRQAALENINFRSALGDYLTGGAGGGSQASHVPDSSSSELEAATRRDIRALVFAQTQLNNTNTSSNSNATLMKALGRNVGGGGNTGTTRLMRFCDFFANNDLSDEDELIEASDTGFLSELLTGNAPTLASAPRAQLLPPLFPGSSPQARSAYNRRSRKLHLQNQLNSSTGNLNGSLMSGGEDDDDSTTTDSNDDEFIGGGTSVNNNSSHLLQQRKGLGPTRPQGGSIPSGPIILANSSKKANSKMLKRASQVDAATMKSFVTELEREFSDIVRDYEDSAKKQKNCHQQVRAEDALGVVVSVADAACVQQSPIQRKNAPSLGPSSVELQPPILSESFGRNQSNSNNNSNNANTILISPTSTHHLGLPDFGSINRRPTFKDSFEERKTPQMGGFGGGGGLPPRPELEASKIRTRRSLASSSPGGQLEASVNTVTRKGGNTERKLKALALEIRSIGSVFLEPRGNTPPQEELQPPQPPNGLMSRSAAAHSHSIRDDSTPVSIHNTAEKKRKATGGLNGVVLSQLFPKRHHMQHSLQEVVDAIDKEEAFPHGWQDQRRTPGSTVLFVGRSKLPRMAQHGIVIPESTNSKAQNNNASLNGDGDTGQGNTSSGGGVSLKHRTGGGLANTNKHTYLTPTQDKVIPLNRELPAWKKAWKLLSENGGTYGTGRKFNLAYSKKVAREVKGTGLNGLCQQKPYHLTPNEKNEIMKDLLRQKSLEKQRAISEASNDLVKSSHHHRQASPIPLPTTNNNNNTLPGTSAAAVSPNKMGKKLQASATTALTALLGWQNHRSVERSSPLHQQHQRSPQHQQHHYPSPSDARSQNESYHTASMSSNQQNQHHHRQQQHHHQSGLDSNGYAREHYMKYPIGTSLRKQAQHQHHHEDGTGVPTFTDDEGAGAAQGYGVVGGGNTMYTVSTKRVQLAPMTEALPPQVAML